MKKNIRIVNNFLRDSIKELQKELEFEISDQGIILEFIKSTEDAIFADETSCKIHYSNRVNIYKLFNIFLAKKESAFSIKKNRFFSNLTYMIDNSRNAVMKVETIKHLIRILALNGFNELQLYTEDTIYVDGNPYFGYLRGRLTKEEIREVVRYASLFSIEVVPCIQTLAHLEGIFKWDEYSSIKDIDNILLVDETKTYTLIEDIVRTSSEIFTSKKINIGMDEAHNVGRGRFLDKFGYQKGFDILLRHLNNVNKILMKYGFTPMMWSDMFFRIANKGDYYSEEKIEFPKGITQSVPRNINLIYWDYYYDVESHYDSMINNHKQFNNSIIFAGACWTWLGFTPFNIQTKKTTIPALNSVIKNNIKDVILTVWNDDGAECCWEYSVFAIYLYSSYCYNGNFDEEEVDELFKTCYHCSVDNFLKLDLANVLGNDIFSNISKIMLYSDPLLGKYNYYSDSYDYMNIYTKHIKTLKKIINANKEMKLSHLFETQFSLIEFLKIKCSLYGKVRQAYLKKDTNELKKICKEIKIAIKKLAKFHSNFRKIWNDNYKPNGLEVLDIRASGQMFRLKHLFDVLNKYVSGELLSISELNIELLSVNKLIDKKFNYLIDNNYLNISTVNKI